MKRKAIVIVLAVVAVIASVLALVGCDKAEDLLFKAPENVEYDGQYITWTKSDGAKHYTVSINGADATRSNSTTFAYESNETFEATVTAVFEKTQKSTSVTFKPLAKIERIDVNDSGELSWDPISGATAYSVSVNGTQSVVTDTQMTTLPTGANRVKVKPIVTGDNSFYSKFSDEVNVYIYSAPTNVKYDGSTLTWTGSSSTYEVFVDGKANVVSGNSFVYNSQNRDFTVEVKTVGNHTSTYDSKSTKEEYHYLEAVKEVFIEDGNVKWNAIDGAEGYVIMIDGVEQKAQITDTQYERLSSGKSHDVAVKPYNNSGNYFSSWSAEKSVYILDTPLVNWNNAIELDGNEGNNVTWSAVNAANGYTVRLTKDGAAPETKIFGKEVFAFLYAFSEVGVYTVEVKTNASPESSDHYDSKYSEPITVERLAAPSKPAESFIVSNKESLASGFTVNFIKVNGASGYQLYKEDKPVDGKYTTASAISDNNVCDKTNIEELNFTYGVRSIGGVKTVSGKKYVTLSCLTSSMLKCKITVLATPQEPTMNGFTMSWNSVSNGNGYAVTYGGTSVTAQTESKDLSTLKAGTYSIAVCARGNGSNVLASNYSSPIDVKRLPAPSNIRIVEDAGLYKIVCDKVEDIAGYKVYLGLSQQALTVDQMNNIYQFISTEGTTVTMVADKNEYNADGTQYIMSSEHSPTQQFIRLAAPVFPEGALLGGTELQWNAPSNVKTSEYTPTYEIRQGEELYGGQLNGTRLELSGLKGGTSYEFKVVAKGNGVKYVDSETSLPIVIYKLATPKLEVRNGEYVWSGVSNASSYYLEIDGNKVSDEYHVSGSEYTYKPRYTSAGEHSVRLRAIGDKNANADSDYFEYKQKVAVLLAPEISYSYSSDFFVTNGAITVRVTTPSANCLAYQYEVGGVAETSKETVYNKTIQAPGSFAIRVKALGGSFDSNDVYYVDSQYAGGSPTDVIKLLETPAEISFAMTVDGVIKWGNVVGQMGYEYQISYNGGEYGELIQNPYNTVEVKNHRQYKTVTVRVRAKGNGGKVVSSAWTVWTWTNPNPTV